MTLALLKFKVLLTKLLIVRFTDLKLASTLRRLMLAKTGMVCVDTLTVIGLQARTVPVIDPLLNTWDFTIKL